MLEALLKCLLLSIYKCKALENCWKLCRTEWGVMIRRLWFEASVRFSRYLYRNLSNLLVGEIWGKDIHLAAGGLRAQEYKGI